MRPGVTLDGVSCRPRKHSDLSDRPNAAPTTFFLTRDPDTCPAPRTSSATLDADSSPVRSLKETLEEADGSFKRTALRHRQPEIRSSSRRRSTIKPTTVDDGRGDVCFQSTPPSQVPSGTLTPLLSTSQELSAPGSPRSISSPSLPKSDDGLATDETGSQAIMSSEDEQDEDDVSPEVQDSAPQLIMPSIKMPSRRPFTERGKQIGRLKILVAGQKGSGRTSLVKSIVQLCEDIVHVDSVTPATKHGHRSSSSATMAINEVYASTKPYPSWWSDIDESRVLKRRKSVGDSVLERNVCFVDIGGSGHPDTVVQYLEQQLMKSINSMNLAGHELTSLLSGRGGSQVDVALYLVTQDTAKEDLSIIRRMSQLCNVVPLLSKSDLLSLEAMSELKTMDLAGTAIPHLPFGKTTDHSVAAQAPYAVSSANGPDFDNMDASLLMSPEYVRPLIPSELASLVEQLFNPDTISYLRHTTAKKLVSWYAAEPRLTAAPSPSVRSPQASTLNSPLPTSLSNSGVLIPVTSELSLNTSNSYALAKVVDHTQREEHLAQIRLSKWASDLQLSLQRERERYENLVQGERAIWLVQKMREEIRDGQIIPLHETQAVVKANEKSRILYPELRYEGHDPLGLLRWQDAIRTRGWAALQIAGSFGVVGGVALWLAKTWGLTSSLQEWFQDWRGDYFGMNE